MLPKISLTILLTTLMVSTLDADIVTLSFTGYDHEGVATQPTTGTSFDSGFVDTMLGSGTHSDSVTTSDGEVTTDRTLDVSVTGNGTGTLQADSFMQSVSTIVPGNGGNKQVDGNADHFIGFTVSQTGTFDFSGALVTGDESSTAAYHYYGIGGFARLEDTTNGTVVYETPTSGTDYRDLGGNAVMFDFNEEVTLVAGTQYQIFLDHYLYSGFDGEGTAEINGGWDVVLSSTAVPEPTGIAILVGLALSLLAQRRRFD